MITAARSCWAALANWILIIWAALPQLLSVLTRGSKIGFVLYLLEPVLLVCALYVVRGVLKQNMPNYGTSLFLFYASGFLPFYLFTQVSSRMQIASVSPNRLLPGISAFDAYIANAFLTALLNITTTIMVFLGMWLYGIDEARPASIMTCVIALGLFLILGVGVGMINNVIGIYLPFWRTVYAVLTRGLVFLSGVIVIIDFLPIWVRNIAVINPLSHGVEWFRLGVYGRYPHNSLDRTYLIEWTIVALFLGFVIHRATVRHAANR